MNIMNFLPAEHFKHKGHGEFSAPCPRCGGTDRFIVWPNHPSGAAGGKFLCRHCTPQGGDGIQFLRDFLGMSFAEARQALGLSSAEQKTTGRRAPNAWVSKEAHAPSAAWQAAAAAFLAETCRNITCEAAATFLQSRELSMETARSFRLGWNPADRFDAPESWGLEPWTNSKGNPGKLFIPAGLVIPTRRRAGIMALNVRRAVVPDGQAKYRLVKGSAAVAFIHGNQGLPCVIVESELDAVTIAQEALGLCSVVAIPAGNRPDAETAAFIRATSRVLYAGDFDEAGKKAFVFWRDNFSCRAWPPAVGKDIGDMHKGGVSVCTWLELGIAEGQPATPPATVPEPKPAKQEWIAAVCCCRFPSCTMLGGRRPLECLWAGDSVTKSEEVM